SSRSRMKPPPMPIMMPMIATPSQSRRCGPRNAAANMAPWIPPRPTPMRSAHRGSIQSGSVTTSIVPGDNGSVPTYRDDAVVLRTHKLGEADRILTLLTRQHGKVRAVAKGVRRTSSKFGARLAPFRAVDAQLYVGRSLDIVQQVDQVGAYGAAIAGDYDRYVAANAMAEAADRLVEEGDAQPQQFFLLVGALRSLARGE